MRRRHIMTVVTNLSAGIVLVVHAHPDDEVFATGAATIAANEAGARVHLRLFTGGEGRGSGTSPAALAAARRRKEARLAASTQLLGIDDWAYLVDPGRWSDTPHEPERTIACAAHEDLIAPVVEAVESLAPDVLLTVGPDGLTGHPDHIACHRAVRDALARSAHTPRLTLGAVLDQRAVQTGRRTAARVLGETVGTGMLTGVRLGRTTTTIIGPPGTEPRRRQALDEYVTGLGTADLPTLDARHIGTGGSALLRFVIDASGWDRDHYSKII